MATITSVAIDKHTTSSTPDPHILYAVDVTLDDGSRYEVLRRYSQFVELHASLGDPYQLPPKKSLAHVVVPSAWVDDELIASRKAGLLAYLNALLRSARYRESHVLLSFLSDDDEHITPAMICKLEANLASQPATSLSTFIAGAYYPDWAASTHPPASLDFSKFDILFFAFVTPNSSASISWDVESQATLQTLVSAAKRSGHATKIVLSMGGWGGSYWFSHSMSSASNRGKLVGALVDAVDTYGLDGIDIDWEYPNSPGSGNPYSYADSANFLSFLKSLRSALGWSKIISAAVAHQPWLGPSGTPLTNVSAYAAQMTYINIMNYDVNGSSSTPGPNAPLGNQCGTSRQPQSNAVAALAQWSRAGMPPSKMLLGLALYGYVSRSSETKLSGSFAPDLNDMDAAHVRSPASMRDLDIAGDLSQWWGQQVAFGQLVKAGAVKKQGGVYVGANGFTSSWDDCSDTPFLFNVSKTTVVSYDDTHSLSDKAHFVRSSGMAGCFTWSLDQDDGYTLHNSVRTALGK